MTACRSLKIFASGVASAVILVAGLSPPVAAQTPPAGQSAPPASAAAMPERFADDVEIIIAELHRTLAIQPSQEALFHAYAEVLRVNAQAISGVFQQRAQAADLTAPARLRWYAQITATHAQAVNRLIAPFDALYQSLSDSQKAAADRHFEQLQQRRAGQRARQAPTQ